MIRLISAILLFSTGFNTRGREGKGVSMNQKIPKTPFATRLSGDAKETELRIRGIFSGKKLRPPVWMFTLIVLVMLGCIGLVSCKTEKDNLWAGLNARIVEIDTEQMILYIQDIDENANVFGQRCALDCKQAAQEERLIFVDYETHEVTDISFYEFQVGDEIIIEMYSSQKDDAKDNTARAEQVQLGTQRPLYAILAQTVSWYSEFIENCQNEFQDYTYTGGTSFTEDDRTYTLFDIPENPIERLLASNYFFLYDLEFVGLRGLQGSETLQLSVDNAAQDAAEGVYIQDIAIHELDTLSEEDFTPGSKYFSDSKQVFEFVDQVNSFKDGHGLVEYAIVYVDLSWQWSEKALSMGPQLDNGRYEWLYLVGKPYERSNWVIYECFWGEYVLGRMVSEKTVERLAVEGKPLIIDWWPIEQESFLVLGQSMEGEQYEVRGERYDVREGVKRMILEESYGVDNWEVTLWHDKNLDPRPLALGWWSDEPLSLVEGEPTIERLDGWDPIHWEGDYWERYTLDGISILRRYSSMDSKNNYVIATVELTRDDFATQRGIRVGDTKEDVKEAYPELKSGDYWGKYPAGDYLWYCEDANDFGPALIFFFENNKVSKIVLNNMFN